jgi:hypothetical protein
MFLLEIILTKFEVLKSFKFILILLMILSSYVSYIIHPTYFLREWIIPLIGYIEIPIAILLLENVKHLKINIKIFQILCILFSLIILLKYYFSPLYSYQGAITLGYTNSNRTAIYLILILSQNLVCYIHSQDKRWKIALLISGILISMLIPLTQSRMSTVCLILIWIMFIFKEKIKINKFIIYLIIISPLFIMYLYMLFYDKSWMRNTIIFEKSLSSGRDAIYNITFYELKDKMLFGNYMFTKFENKHNVLLTVLGSCGILGVIFFVIYYVSSYCKIFEYSKTSREKYYILLLLLCIYINGFAESALYVSGIMFAGMYISIHSMAFIDKTDKEELND